MRETRVQGDASRAAILSAIVTAVLTYLLVALGSTVRVTDSGMGCPSWPLCYGQLGPIYHLHPILEESHRYLAALVTVFAFITMILVLRSTRAAALRTMAKVSFGLVLFQVLLGGLTVLAKNAPWTVALHLLTGFAFLGVTTATAALAVLGHRYLGLSDASRRWGMSALTITLLLLFSGTLVVGAGAGKICPTWPVCFANGPGRLTFIALLHRVTMGASGLVILGFIISGWQRGGRAWRSRAVLLAVLVGLVAAIGAAVAISKSSPALADIHLAAAAALWVVLVVQVVTAPSPLAARQDAEVHGQLA